VPIFLENTCVLLMGVLSTFLVSWLGKEAMAGVGLADSFNMVVMSFCRHRSRDDGGGGFSLGKLDPKRAREAARQSLMIMTVFSIVLAAVIHYFGKEIIDFVAGEATNEVKDLALTYLEMTVISYPAAAIALIGSGALRGAGNTKIPPDQRRNEYPEYHHQQRADLRRVLVGRAGVRRRRTGANHFTLYRCGGDYRGADGGDHPSLRLTLKSYFRPFNFAIIWEVMGIGIPAIESVLFNGGKLLTQMFVAGMGTDVIAGNFIAFSIASLINLPGNALGSASTIITGNGSGKGR
jgi:Na+-driven multidrug efflux pump